MVGWLLQVMVLKAALVSLGGGEAPLLDIVAYAGYTFTGMCIAVVGRMSFGYAYYFIVIWACFCMGVFLVKTLKRTLFAEMRNYHPGKRNYLLLSIAFVQFPLIFWLSNINGN